MYDHNLVALDNTKRLAICGVLLLFFLLLSTASGFSQSKYENEKRIKQEEVPQAALTFSQKIAFNKRIKWYKEVSQQGVSFELKTKYKGLRYSIEFDTTGQIQDVEKTIKLKSLDQKTVTTIETSLKEQFQKYKIIKVQKQWVSDPATLVELIEYNATQQAYELKYELVLKGLKDGHKDYFEVLIDANGAIEQILRIVQRNSANLEF
jgi:hypothetical protein